MVPGRVRWRVHGLRGNPVLKARLEVGLTELSEVQFARASADTGNLLTYFAADISPERIRVHIAACVQGRRQHGAAAPGADWHARPVADVATALHASATAGIDADEARRRLAEHGANVLRVPPLRSGLEIFVGQFGNLPSGMLAAAGVFSLLTGGIAEAIAILSVVGLNGVLGAMIESRSERTIHSLAETTSEPVPVVRGGLATTVQPDQLVPGDLITLCLGAIVPADARVVSGQGLRVNEAMLTGESLPVPKRALPVEPAAALADRTCMVFRGTAVTGGSGTAIVVATGSHTEMGRVQRLVGRTGKPLTPMQVQLDLLGRQLVWASIAACVAVIGVGALRGVAMWHLLRSGVSLAVAAIPEGLPTVATTGLALGIEAMRKEGVLVRRLHALETLASVGIVCFDKTGTLTLNQMRVAQVVIDGRHLRVDADGILYAPDANPPVSAAPTNIGANAAGADTDGGLVRLLRVAVLCSDAGLALSHGQLVPTGSATEGALVRLALATGLDVAKLRDDYPRLAVRHRAEGYRYMATAHRRPADDAADGALVAVKGSPAEVLALCAWELRDGQRRRLTAARRDAIGRINATMASDALRVLGFAVGEAAESVLGQDDSAATWPGTGLTWLGMAGMADPIRPGMSALIRTLHEAGLRTVMMTGDQVPTAMAVARQLKLAGDDPVQILDVTALEQLSDQELTAAVRRAHGFARVSPADKMRLVRVLQKAGERIAMTGDGINDSPALRAADVGLAMGGSASSQAAREVADVVLLTDELTTLADAIERGRTTFVNVRKSIRYLLATNLSEILVVLGATAAGYGEPLTAMQLLWINLASDVLPGLGLTFEPPGPRLMHRPPNGGANAIIQHDEWGRMGLQAGVIASGSLAALGIGALRHGVGPEGRTMAFGSLITAQLLHALVARSERQGLFTPGTTPLSPNRPLTRLLLGSVVFQAAALLIPGVRTMLGVVPLDPVDMAVMAGAGVLPYIANEALKISRSDPVLPTMDAAGASA